MNNEEIKYKIFKIFYHNTISEEELNYIKRELTSRKYVNIQNYKAMMEGIFANYCATKMMKSRETNQNIIKSYYKLLENMTILSKELDMNNSLELNILFCYLLWNGYLSLNKEYQFSTLNKRNIDGMFFADIIDGKGVCLNNSEMLKDFLCYNGYTSVMLQNFYNEKSTYDYRIPIKKNRETSNTKDSIIKKILKRDANHVFNLIEDNGKIYVFDSTNLSIHRILSPFKSSLINGTGNFKLYPYRSYATCYTEKEIILLDKLLTISDYSYPYNQVDLISTCHVDLDILTESANLLNDFYSEVYKDILYISKEAAKIKQR